MGNLESSYRKPTPTRGKPHAGSRNGKEKLKPRGMRHPKPDFLPLSPAVPGSCPAGDGRHAPSRTPLQRAALPALPNRQRNPAPRPGPEQPEHLSRAGRWGRRCAGQRGTPRSSAAPPCPSLPALAQPTAHPSRRRRAGPGRAGLRSSILRKERNCSAARVLFFAVRVPLRVFLHLLK